MKQGMILPEIHFIKSILYSKTYFIIELYHQSYNVISFIDFISYNIY